MLEKVRTSVDAQARSWISAFGHALARQDAAAVGQMFQADSHGEICAAFPGRSRPSADPENCPMNYAGARARLQPPGLKWTLSCCFREALLLQGWKSSRLFFASTP